MVNSAKIRNIIKDEIYKLRNLGEHSREESDHLYYRSLSILKLGNPKKVKYQEKLAFEVICKYDFYTEPEFLHPPEMNYLYTEHYNDKFVFDEDFVILDSIDLNKKK